MKKRIPIRLLLVISSFAPLLFEISSIYGQPAQQPWIDSGPDKGVLARHSKSPDGRYALAWVVAGDQTAIDWELLKNTPDSFYEKYDLRELWVVDLRQNRKLCSLGTSIGYVQPGSHRTLSVAWGPLEGGRRFAIIGYEWKWGTEALILLDIGSDNCAKQIGQILDSAAGAAVKKSTAQGEACDFEYNISDLPEIGLKTGFSNSTTLKIPFTVKSRERDKPVAEDIATLKLTRRADTPSVTVNKVSIEQLREDPFADDARLAKADRELNALYLHLLKRLKPADQEALKTDERDWIQQRETEAANVKGDYYDNNRIASDRALQRLTEQRIAELRKRIDSPRKQ